MTAPTPDPRLPALERYRAQLAALLSMLDAEEGVDATAMLGLWERCQETFAEYQGMQATMGDVPCSGDVHAAIKESMRMNVVAVSELVRHKAELCHRKGALKREQAMLEARRTVPSKGRSCDLSG